MSELRADNLTVGYGGAPLVSEIDLRIRPGAIVALVGPNGSGKSTLLRTLAGSLAPVRGAVLLDGADLRTVPRSTRARTEPRRGKVAASYC